MGESTRFLDERRTVKLAFDIENRIIPSGRTAYNVLEEISGTDLAGQVVMFGAHLDSWHVATGATDDAVGCAIMMEAAASCRRLKVWPRRTLRIALWSGEEQGLLGSQDYVARHFGTAEAPQPEFPKPRPMWTSIMEPDGCARRISLGRLQLRLRSAGRCSRCPISVSLASFRIMCGGWARPTQRHFPAPAWLQSV